MCSRPMLRDLFAIALACALLTFPTLVAQKPTTPQKPVLSAEDEQRIKEFKQFANDPNDKIRAEQMERIAFVDNAEGAGLLVSVGLKDDSFHVRDRATYALSTMKTPEAISVIVNGLKNQNEFVQGGCIIALARMEKRPEGVARDIAVVAETARKEEVRISACEALGIIGSKDGTKALMSCVVGAPEKVAIAALDSLALVNDPTAAATAIGALKGGTWRTQLAAIHALEVMRVKEGVMPLIDYLAASEGRPKDECRKVLERLTQMTLGYNVENWMTWWKRAEADWKFPPPKKEEKEVGGKDQYGRGVPVYHKMPIVTKKVLFVIDISNSMLDEIRVKRGRGEAKDLQFQSSPKLDLAREELASALRALDDNTFFNLCAFETDVRPWQKEPVKATKERIQEAIRWIEGQKPATPNNSRSMRQSDGLNSDGMMAGRTNTYAALKYVFGFPPGKPKTGTGGTTGNPRKAGGVGGIDTCFFLTDGEPTEGETTNIDEILADVKVWNKSAKIKINCVGMSETRGLRTLLDDLAKSTGGQCIFVGE